MGEMNVKGILERCDEVGVAMTEKEAKKMVQMLNYNAGVRQVHTI
jgi:hypothetical protein